MNSDSSTKRDILLAEYQAAGDERKRGELTFRLLLSIDRDYGERFEKLERRVDRHRSDLKEMQTALGLRGRASMPTLNPDDSGSINIADRRELENYREHRGMSLRVRYAIAGTVGSSLVLALIFALWRMFVVLSTLARK